MAETVYREICPYLGKGDNWKEITIDGGASQRPLQDIDLPQTAGCFSYSNGRHSPVGTSNRFIIWRTNKDLLEMYEDSLDLNLRGNHIHLHFQHTPVLKGVSIHETSDSVVVLVPTVSTIHKFAFKHPSRLPFMEHFQNDCDAVVPSIFFDATLETLQSCSTYHVLNHASLGMALPHTACSYLMPGGRAAFVLANSTGSLSLVIMTGEQVTCCMELNRTSIMSRLWNGIIRGTSNPGDAIVSIVCHQNKNDTYIFTMNRELQIHMYSQNREECLMEACVLQHKKSREISASHLGEQCYMKKSVGSVAEQYFLGVCVSLSHQNQFFIFQPLCINDKFQLSHVATLHHRQQDLVDFCVTSSHVWTLWYGPDCIPKVEKTSFEQNSSSSQVGEDVNWFPMELEQPMSTLMYVPPDHPDPKEFYIKEIFHQGRFPSSIILKGVNIMRRHKTGEERSMSFQNHLNSKEEILHLIENEMCNFFQDTNITEKEFTALQVDYLAKLLTYCFQYHQIGAQPLGVTYDSESGCVIVIKKDTYSILRPYEPLEQLLSCSSIPPPGMNLIAGDDSLLCSNLLVISECLRMIKDHLTMEMTAVFEQNLQECVSAVDIAQDIVKELQVSSGEDDDSLLSEIQSRLKTTANILPALRLLIQFLDFTPKDFSNVSDLDEQPFTEYPNFLNGDAGISILCEAISQFVKQRFEFSRNFLLLQILVVNIEQNSGLNSETIARIQNEIIPSTKNLVQVYFTLKWCSECDFIPKTVAVLEVELGQLSILDLPINVASSEIRKSPAVDVLGKTIIYHFLIDQGRALAYSLLSNQMSYENFCEREWSSCIPQIIKNVIQILWPLGPYFSFLEYLLSKGQCVQLQGYINLLQSWCEWNKYSLLFFLANCNLILGDQWKAVELFITTAEGVDGISREEYLIKKVLLGASDSSSLLAQYYLKVIQFFQHFNHSDCIIKLGMKAIGILDKKDPNIPIFWSLVFKYHLELCHEEEAFMALIKNPDCSRQKNCLRSLIYVLVERKKFQTLIEFPYGDIQDEVISILESRARSSDLLDSSFYDLLYSFHVHTGNFRRAASTMFEYGMRLGQEVPSLEGLRKQASCFLVTLNCLHIVNPKYAWIVKPVPKIIMLSDGSLNEESRMSPKRNIDDEIMSSNASITKGIEVLEISDIQRECNLIQARLLLAESNSSEVAATAMSLSPTDCIALLVNAGLLENAIKLCKAFSLDLAPVFEGLSHLCIKFVHRGSHSIEKQSKDYFQTVLPNCSSIFQSHPGYLSASKQILYILKHYLEKYEAPSETKFHRYVTTKLLSSGLCLPAWLHRSYQKRNPAELLYLYLNFGIFDLATDLALNYIDAVMGHGEQDFGIKYPLQNLISSQSWLPYTYIDVLIDALEDEDTYSELLVKLRNKIDLYNKKVSSVSEALQMDCTV